MFKQNKNKKNCISSIYVGYYIFNFFYVYGSTSKLSLRTIELQRVKNMFREYSTKQYLPNIRLIINSILKNKSNYELKFFLRHSLLQNIVEILFKRFVRIAWGCGNVYLKFKRRKKLTEDEEVQVLQVQTATLSSGEDPVCHGRRNGR